ncbi:hypothetical protein TNCV_1079691 [Trichonephila clavipes]|nr:hypothetical protein TNCV_1079691 [Trichonephila clavipes]
MFSMGWVPCRGDRYYSRPSVATNIASETHGHTVFLFWTVRRYQTDGAYIGDLKHGIGPFLCITSIQHRLSQWSPRGQVLRIMSFPSLICQTVYAGFGMQSSQSLNEGSFSFGSLLLHVVTGHVLWFRTSKGSDAKNVQRMMIREHFGQQLPNTLFSVSVEVNNFGRLQAVDNDSKLRHKRNVIREMHSLVLDQVDLKCVLGLHVYEATGFRVLFLY